MSPGERQSEVMRALLGHDPRAHAAYDNDSEFHLLVQSAARVGIALIDAELAKVPERSAQRRLAMERLRLEPPQPFTL